MRFRGHIIATLAVGCFLSMSNAHYTVEVLPSYGGEEAVIITDMNDSGWITGYYPDGQYFRSVVWNTSEWIPVEGLSSKSTFVNAVNNAGTAVGQSDLPTVLFHGITLEDGVVSDVTPANRAGSMYDINDSGTICGYAYVNGIGTRACTGTPQGLQYLATLGGNMSMGRAISNSNVIVGMSSTVVGHTEAFINVGSTMTSIAPQDALWSSAEAVNDLGWAVGMYRTLQGFRGFYFDGSESFDVGMPAGGQELWLTDINNAGTAVGYCGINDTTAIAVKYECGNLVDVSTLVDTSSGIQLGAAFAVNNQGWIAVLASLDGIHGVTAILKPVEP